VATERYEALHAMYLGDGERLLADGDLPQASEKIWGAVAQMIKVVAATRGLRHSSHRALHEVVNTIYQETEDEEFMTLLSSANRLHVNFYENDLDSETVTTLVGEAIRLASKLRSSLSGGTP